jgi:hypothetical protein
MPDLILNNNLSNIQRPNLLNELYDFETDFPINKYLGGSGADIYFDTGSPFYGQRCIEIYMQSNSAGFNEPNGFLTFTATETGLYNLQAKVFKSSNISALGVGIKVYVNNEFVFTKYSIQIAPNNPNLIFSGHNTLMQSMFFTAGDIVNFSFEFESDIYPEITSLDGMKLEFLGQGGIPSNYSPPSYDKLVWQNKVDTIGTQNILANTDTKVFLTGVITALGTNNLIVTNTHLIRPYKLGAMLIINYSFPVLVPVGSNKIVKILPKVNGVTLNDGSKSYELIESVGSIQSISGSFMLHATEEIMVHHLGIFINSNVDLIIQEKNITITQLRN